MASEAPSMFEHDSPATVSGDRDVLRHLLGVESEASALVDNAQAEADRRVAEGEKDGRARYDARYGEEAALLDGNYAGAVQAVKDDYQRQLDAYRKSLEDMPVRKDGFAALVERLLFGGR